MASLSRRVCVDRETRSKVRVERRETAPRIKGDHLGPADAPGAKVLRRWDDAVVDPYAETRTDLELLEADPAHEERWLAASDLLVSPDVAMHPAERSLVSAAAAGTVEEWRPPEGAESHRFDADLWVIPLRSPTLPPARHTNMSVLAGPGIAVDPAAWNDEERRRGAALLTDIDRNHHRLSALWLTHHHDDHHASASWLSEELGLPIWAHVETARRVAPRVRVDRTFEDLEDLPNRAGDPSGWVALHTPGHAPGHLCVWHQGQGRLIAGDMIAGQGTILIDPEDGDMATYLRSLRALADLKPRWTVPAHGPLLARGVDVIEHTASHRLAREQKIVEAIGATSTEFEAVLTKSYDDVPAAVLPLAARSLETHLRKLEVEGRIRREGRRITPAGRT